MSLFKFPEESIVSARIKMNGKIFSSRVVPLALADEYLKKVIAYYEAEIQDMKYDLMGDDL